MLSSVASREEQAIEEISARNGEPFWLQQHRLKAARLYADMPLPTGTEEEWRRVDLRALSVEGLDLSAEPAVAARQEASYDEGGYGGRIVQQDGVTLDRRLSRELERQGVAFNDLHTAAREQPDIFRAYFMTEAVQPIAWKLVALHAALWKGGVFLYAPAGANIDVPLNARVAAADAEAVFPHTLIVAEEGSSVTLIEEHDSNETGRHRFTSGVVEILVRRGASVRYIGAQDWSRGANAFATIRAIVDEEGRLEIGLVGTGANISKTDVEVILSAPGATASIAGLILASGEQKMSYVTLQDHRARNTTSDLLLKSAVKDSAQLVWNGLTRIRKGAGESDANQTCRNLLLGENARVAPIPVLEIEAHDVARCSHGATVSSVDEEQLYYIMSRGLSRREATEAIVDGFFREGLERMSPVRAHDFIGRLLEQRLIAKAA
ncbi:MAG: Fe-S cluster assembly protein SufD [Dehalococcoidia bacterium]|jgi:Fe-S cluster assembly protein SufD